MPHEDEAASIGDALGRLDQDIADAERDLEVAERRVAELRAMRASVQPFIDRYLAATRAQADAKTDQVQPISFIDEVIKVFGDHPGAIFDVDDTWEHVRQNVPDASRESVRNAINYAVRQGKVLRDSQRRGRYILKSTSTPAATGVDVGEESDMEDSSRGREEYRDETSVPPHDQAGSANTARFSFDRDGGRAPIRA